MNQVSNIFHSNKLSLIIKSKNISKEFQDKEQSLNMKKEDMLRLSQEKLPRSTIMPLNTLNNMFLRSLLKLMSKWFQLKELSLELNISQSKGLNFIIQKDCSLSRNSHCYWSYNRSRWWSRFWRISRRRYNSLTWSCYNYIYQIDNSQPSYCWTSNLCYISTNLCLCWSNLCWRS